jgi:hypothetical protein
VKYVLILILLAFVLGLIYMRLRPYIKAARRFLGVVREAQRMGAPPTPPSDLPRRERRAGASAEKLVRCASCGTWTAASRAVSLRATGVSYCSHACLERAADAPPRERKSAS